MSLEEEIRQGSWEVASDSYSMSVGELVFLYKEGVLSVNPEFQQFFRWTSKQKSRFVESLLLGIPIPSIFVSQNENSKWEVLDGNQRLATILELFGELRDEDGKHQDRLILDRTKYLGNLEGKQWISDSPDKELPESAKMRIRLARLDLKILINTSIPSAKYELFRRLNTGGTLIKPYEVRNCILIMENRNFFKWLQELAQDGNFQTCLPQRATDEQFDIELLVRFLVLRRMSLKDLRKKLKKAEEPDSFLTNEIVAIARAEDYNMAEEKKAFIKTFTLLARNLGEDAFKRFDPDKRRALGPPLVSAFEVIACGMGYH